MKSVLGEEKNIKKIENNVGYRKYLFFLGENTSAQSRQCRQQQWRVTQTNQTSQPVNIHGKLVHRG